MRWSELPFDLIFAIFAVAARTNKRTPLSLTFVTKEIQSVGDRVLFKDILVGTSRKTSQMLKSMFTYSCPSQRLLRAREYIRSLRALSDREIASNVLDNALRYCINLRLVVTKDITLSPAFWITSPPGLHTLGLTSVHGHRTFIVNFSSAALFCRITHLVIEELDVVDIRPLLHAPNLTHLFLGCTSRSIPPWDNSSSLPPQIRLCLVYLGFYQTYMTDSVYHKLIANSPFSDIQDGIVNHLFVPVTRHRFSNWPGSNTCRGFLVAPDNWGEPCHSAINYFTLYATGFTDRKAIYNWLEDARDFGEEIVKRRETNC
ncbi:hypothetical protein DL96DRAFT_1821226 [Flagelloscypha sp. PMI_526]|nr:hypothetical protein DL96DRAFT_1821226 [Flagelloscypha sp. PMI_526]